MLREKKSTALQNSILLFYKLFYFIGRESEFKKNKIIIIIGFKLRERDDDDEHGQQKHQREDKKGARIISG